MSMLPRLKPALLLRSGDRDRHRAARPHPGADGAPLPAPPAGLEPVDYPSDAVRGGARAHPGGAHLPGAGDQAGHGGGRFFRRRGRRPAPRHRLPGGARAPCISFEEQADRGMPARATPESSPSRSTSRSWVSVSTAFRNPIPRASRSSPTSPPGSSATTPAAFTAALLNSQPMGFYAPSQLVQDAGATGSACCRWMCAPATGTARLETKAGPRQPPPAQAHGMPMDLRRGRPHWGAATSFASACA
jgi:error-prone DNA polymerase